MDQEWENIMADIEKIECEMRVLHSKRDVELCLKAYFVCIQVLLLCAWWQTGGMHLKPVGKHVEVTALDVLVFVHVSVWMNSSFQSSGSST
jgi:hypothetical protein